MNKIFKLNLFRKSSNTPKKAKGRFKEKIQLFARGLLVPITLLAFAGLFLGIGAVIGKYVTDGPGHTVANVIKNIGNVVFYLLPLLFAVAIASSMTNNNGTAILTAIVVWVAIQMIAGAQFEAITKKEEITGYSWFGVIDFANKGEASVITKPFGFNTLDLSVFGGFISGPIAIFAYNKFKNQRMPIFLQMFQGTRFVPIMGLILAVPTSIIVALIWPWFSKAFIEFGQQTGKLPGGLDSLLFGVLERALLPTGLHHMFYSPLLYTEAGATVQAGYKVASTVTASGIHFAAGTPLWVIDAGPFKADGIDVMKNISGVQLINYNNTPGINYDATKHTLSVTQALVKPPSGLKELQGDRTAFQQLNGSNIQFKWINDLQNGNSVHLGRFAAGKFPLMVFGIPAAGIAMILTAPKEKRKLVTGVVGSAALTSLLTGITEPFEYSFLFLAPVLFYGFHIWLAGLSYMLANVSGVYYGPSFGGIIDFFIYGVAPHVSGQYTGFYWLLLIGVGLAAIYFFGFYFAIKKFNLKTPGRGEGNIKMTTKADYKAAKGQGLDKLSIKGQIMYKALGGRDNLKVITNCASRLRVTVVDPSKVDYELANTTQPFGVVGKDKTSQQYIYGPAVQTIADTVLGLFEGKIKAIDLTDNAVEETKPTNKKQAILKTKLKVMAPATGIMKNVKELKDGVFSEGMMGDGIFIKLPNTSEKQIMTAPVSGELVTVFPTGHAYGIKTDEGLEVLLHIGVDTVNLNGKGFKSLVKQGDKVTVGDKLVEVNTKELEGKVPSYDPVLLITSGQKIKKYKKDLDVKVNELAFEIE